MKILHLTLKKKWFDMILSGDKKEEYRDIKPYWIKRLLDIKYSEYSDKENVPADIIFDLKRHEYTTVLKAYRAAFKKYDVVCFKNGYAKDAPHFTIELKGFEIKKAKPEWSDNWPGLVFAIKLGKKYESTNHRNKMELAH